MINMDNVKNISNLSIVTINKNNYQGLIQTFNSIKNVNSESLFHIVVDGNSNDFVESLDQLQLQYAFIYVSGNDSGIYEAMNKGIQLSSSNYLLFLNSGDCLSNSSSLSSLLLHLGNFDLVYGDIIDFGQSTPHFVSYPDSLSFEYMLCRGLPHQATAIRKRLFDSIGVYSEKYKIISDWVFFMEALFIHNVSYKHIPIVISNFEGGGLSSISKNTALILFEQLDYISQRFPDSLLYYYNNSPYVKKYLRQKPRVLRWFFKYMLITYNKVFQ